MWKRMWKRCENKCERDVKTNVKDRDVKEMWKQMWKRCENNCKKKCERDVKNKCERDGDVKITIALLTGFKTKPKCEQHICNCIFFSFIYFLFFNKV